MAVAGYSVESEQVAEWADVRIAELMGTINAATAGLVAVIGTVIESGAWGGGGLRSPAHWVAWRAGVSATRAAALVAMARRLPKLATVSAAFSEGRLSEDSVKVVVARTPAERDEEVAELAQLMTVSQLGRTLRSLPEQPAEDPQAEQPEADGGGEVSFGYGDGGRWSLRATDVPAERGALVQKAMEAARDAEFRARHPEAAEGARATGVTWSDALERMALVALDALDPSSRSGGPPSERYQVLVHVRGDDGGSHLHLGPALTAEARRRITCGASVRSVLEQEGRPVAWGRKRATIPTPLRRLIEDRDRGCRVPGCTQARWLEVHHITHVEDGGETVPENLAVLCGRHHDDHHRGLLGIAGDPTIPGGLVFTDRWGRDMSRPPPTPPKGPPTIAGHWVAPSGEPLDGRWFTWN
jgi:hypothetical protein